MADEFRQRVRRLFLELADLPKAQRAAALAKACGADESLKGEVEALLRAEEEAAFMAAQTADFRASSRETAAIAVAGPRAGTASELEGQMIGRYRLLQMIGEGGFGSVWMAEQREPVKRRVALKIIKLGMDTKQVIARFEAERQALAMMDHPNIAKVLDAGSTELGRPYFVMEYIKGVPILEYCDDGQLDTRSRLELFTHVCHAIQHAHQKGIIHRDIKPSNILVTMHDGVPVPKVIDFGIAKATNADLTNRTLFTQHRQMIGTPAYMSPEQAEMSGLDIDTRSDIYSLGVLLYELLTGTTPFANDDLMKKGYAEMMRVIREDEPQKPSTRLSTLGEAGSRTAEQRHAGDVRRLGLLLRGDLDWIAMKCLEKDRSRRYETANALAADIKRHLAGDAVIAAPPDPWYMLTKIMRRHRVALGVAGVLAAAMILGLAFSAYGLVRARKERDEADAARALTEQAGLKLLEQSAHEKRMSELLKARLLQPTPFGGTAEEVALSLKNEAEEVFGVGKPEVSALLAGVGAMLSTDVTREREAEAVLRTAVDYLKNSAGSIDLARVMPHIAMASLKRMLNPPESVKSAREVLRLIVEVHGEGSLASANAREALALHLISSGRKEDFAEAVSLYTLAIPAYAKQLGPLHARTLDSQMACGQALMAINKYDEGGAMMEAAFESARSVRDTSLQIRFTTAANLRSLYAMRKDKAREAAIIIETTPLVEEVFGAGSELCRRYLASNAEQLRTLGDGAGAERLDKLIHESDASGDLPAARMFSAWSFFNAGDFARARQKAADLLQEMPATATAPWDRYARFGVQRLLIESMARSGQPAEAEREARAMIAETESSLGPSHSCVTLARRTLAEVLIAAARKDEAVRELRSAIVQSLARSPKDFGPALTMLETIRASIPSQDSADVTAELRSLEAERDKGPFLGGFEGQDVGAPPWAWMMRREVLETGMICVVCDTGARTGQRCLRLGGLSGVDKTMANARLFRNIMQSFDARPYQGKKVRFSAAVRLESPGSSVAEARLWMRADRPGNTSPHMFDNMGDHPVRPGDWAMHELLGTVDADADTIYIGVMVFDEGIAWVDDMKFEVVDEGAPAGAP